MMPIPRVVDFSADLQGICPCGKKFFVDSEACAVAHESPFCRDFMDLKPTDYLKFLNERIAKFMRENP